MSERVYKLLHGGELLVSEEVIGMRLSPEGMPITVDVEHLLDDVLSLVDHLQQKLIDKDSTIETLTKQITDEVAISAAGLIERDRLRNKLGEVQQNVRDNYVSRNKLVNLLNSLLAEKSNELARATNRVAKESADDQIKLLDRIASLCEDPPEFDFKRFNSQSGSNGN